MLKNLGISCGKALWGCGNKSLSVSVRIFAIVLEEFQMFIVRMQKGHFAIKLLKKRRTDPTLDTYYLTSWEP